MAYDTSNLPNVMQYLQQQQNQGSYVPSNGANGVPSQGWDGWGGYNPATTYQASSGGGVGGALAGGGGIGQNQTGSIAGYNGLGQGQTTSTGQNLGSSSSGAFGGSTAGASGSGNTGGSNPATNGGGYTDANGTFHYGNYDSGGSSTGINLGHQQIGGGATPPLTAGGGAPGFVPADQLSNVHDGYLQNNFQMGTNSRSTDVGQSGYSRNDITAMHNDPSLAANTPFAQYLQGGKAGTGTPISFQGFYAQQANRAMNAGIDPSGMDYRSMIDQMTAQQRAARQATNQQQFAANQANTQARQAMPTNGSIARAQPNYTYAKPPNGTLSGGPNNGHNMTYLTNFGNGSRVPPLGAQIGQLSPNPVTSGMSSPYTSPNAVNSGVSSPYQPQSNTVPGTNYSLDDIHGFLNGAGGNKILGQGGPYRAI